MTSHSRPTSATTSRPVSDGTSRPVSAGTSRGASRPTSASRVSRPTSAGSYQAGLLEFVGVGFGFGRFVRIESCYIYIFV